MEESVLKGLAKVLDSLANTNITTEVTYEENPFKYSEAPSSNSLTPMGSINEGPSAQNIPKTSFHPGLLSDNLFHLKNESTGQEVDLKNPGESFFERLNSLINLEKYTEAMEFISSQKEKMNSALWHAAHKNEHDLCRLLLDKKTYGDLAADPNSLSSSGMSALHIAAVNGHIKVCEVILDYGYLTDINIKDVEKRTPLHLACIHNQLTTAQLLVRSGAQINSQDSKGNTPTHYAAQNQNEDLIAWLACRYPDLTIKNNLSQTPGDLATQGVRVLLNTSCIPPAVMDLSPQHIQIISTGEEEVRSILTPSPEKPSNKKEPKRIRASDFEAIQLLGKGSFGEVYLVEMRETKELYAMKILNKERILSQNLVKYAMTERNVLSYIKHPFIVGLKYAFQTSSRLYLILDYCPGGSLGSLIHKERRFTENRARIYICEILLAIQELHARDIIYRDLKPDNIVLDKDGHALLTDFGLSKEGIIDNHSTNSFCGSVAYLAPEMLKRQGHGKSVDWYLLGVLFYEMIVGFPPYYSKDRDQMFSDIQRGKLKIPTTMSVDARSLLKELLNRDPLKRMGSRRGAEEVKEHPFFYGINWDSVFRKELRPPKPQHIQIVRGVLQQNVIGNNSSCGPETRITGWTFISK